MRGFASVALIIFGLVALAVSLLTSITQAGSQFVNLSLIHFSLTLQVWGFGLIIVGLLLGRPPAPKD